MNTRSDANYRSGSRRTAPAARPKLVRGLQRHQGPTGYAAVLKHTTYYDNVKALNERLTKHLQNHHMRGRSPFSSELRSNLPTTDSAPLSAVCRMDRAGRGLSRTTGRPHRPATITTQIARVRLCLKLKTHPISFRDPATPRAAPRRPRETRVRRAYRNPRSPRCESRHSVR